MGKAKGISYLGDTTNFMNRFKRTQFLVNFENSGNLARRVTLVKIPAPFL